MDFKNKKVLVVGMAKSGLGTVKTLTKLGAEVYINDIKPEEKLQDLLSEIKGLYKNAILGEHPQNIRDFDIIILSPGVPTDLEFINKAKNLKIPVIGELELAFKLSKGTFIGITGTNGKTTTTALLGEIFNNAGIPSYVVGNIGTAAITKALDTDDKTVMITEVSSFQLETIEDFKPKIAAILNISPDHLNRHKTMDNYINAKSRIFQNQESSDYLILNYDCELTKELSKKAKSKIIFFSRKEKLDKGIYINNGEVIIAIDEGKKDKICDVPDILIPGSHNLENALAASAIAYAYGIDKEIIAYTLKSFQGVEHRIELVTEIDGVKFINDSKGTNVNASIKAIEAVKPPIILIAGGKDKGSSFDDFIKAFNGKVEKLVLLGETANKIKETAIKYGFHNIFIVKDMEEAVKEAFKNAKKGSTVLLSPACASWDMYENFEERGEDFKRCVNKLRR